MTEKLRYFKLQSQINNNYRKSCSLTPYGHLPCPAIHVNNLFINFTLPFLLSKRRKSKVKLHLISNYSARWDTVLQSLHLCTTLAFRLTQRTPETSTINQYLSRSGTCWAIDLKTFLPASDYVLIALNGSNQGACLSGLLVSSCIDGLSFSSVHQCLTVRMYVSVSLRLKINAKACVCMTELHFYADVK